VGRVQSRAELAELGGDKYVRAGISLADAGSFRSAQPSVEVGNVSVANIVGLVLAVLIALLLVAALMYPERF
jgi:hypothetical protein